MPWLMTRSFYLPLFCMLALMLMVEWTNRDQQHGLARLTPLKWINWLVYYAIIFLMYKYQPMEEVQFIYFQF